MQGRRRRVCEGDPVRQVFGVPCMLLLIFNCSLIRGRAPQGVLYVSGREGSSSGFAFS
jgi:hypothetical protein